MILIKTAHDMTSFISTTWDGLEAYAVYLYPRNHTKLLSVAAYLLPTSELSAMDLDHIVSQNDSVIIFGDLNCKHVFWNNASVNRNVRALLTYFIGNEVTLSYPDKPTYYPYHSDPSLLDIALTKRCPLSKPNAIPILFLDQNTVAFKTLLHPTTSNPRIRYNYPQAYWALFRVTLDLALHLDLPFHTTIDLEYTINIFETSVCRAARSAIPIHIVHHTQHSLLPNVYTTLRL